MEMPPFFLFFDPYLIRLYRITGYAWVDFFLGTMALAFIVLIIGEFTISLAFLASRKRIERVTDEAVKYQNLSMEALAAGDKEAYRAANKLANDAYGHSFFMQLALSAAFLWPICFALVWMGYRFSGLEFPLPFTGLSMGYMGVFILLYVAAYQAFKRVKYKLPYFRRIKVLLDGYRRGGRPVKSLMDFLPQSRGSGKS